MGTGNSGSIILSNTLPYHNVLRFTLFGSRYKYSFIMSLLPHLTRDAENGLHEGGGGVLFYMTHRLECRFLSDRLYAAINESVMYRDDEGLMDLRYINPVMYFHNYFISRTTNSIIDVEASFTMPKGWNLYGQFAIDQFASPVEKSEDDYNDPLALGAMLGIQNVSLVGKGVLTIGLEGVYTMPYLYHRAKSIDDWKNYPIQSDTDPGLGYIGSFRGKMFYIGYTYGSDAVAADLKVTYEVPSDWKVRIYMVHGEKNVRALFRMDDDSFAPSGETWTFGLVELKAKKHFKNYAIYGQYDFIFGESTDHQFTLGAEVDF